MSSFHGLALAPRDAKAGASAWYEFLLFDTPSIRSSRTPSLPELASLFVIALARPGKRLQIMIPIDLNKTTILRVSKRLFWISLA